MNWETLPRSDVIGRTEHTHNQGLNEKKYCKAISVVRFLRRINALSVDRDGWEIKTELVDDY